MYLFVIFLYTTLPDVILFYDSVSYYCNNSKKGLCLIKNKYY